MIFVDPDWDKEEPPKELTPKTVIFWSKTYKQLEILEKEGKFKTYSIRAKARKFVEANCIDYVKKAETMDGKGYYRCKPLTGYNKTTYKMYSLPGGEFDCNCQFYQRVVKFQKIPNLICSHICALKMQLKIWNWQKKHPESCGCKYLEEFNGRMVCSHDTHEHGDCPSLPGCPCEHYDEK